ncbi:MAG: hypothetical protein PHZ24_06010 [Bacteroidales bacterium]|nr:hypothetical protein [Bacteroidales bacterium]MDY0141914.1 hypothetical protein [Bacteroidales bacterium]
MKNIKFLVVIVIISLLGTIGFSCDKPDDPPSDEQIDLVFTSLTADKDSVDGGNTVVLTAQASGKDITYSWTVSLGSFLGSGSKVTYVPSSCTFGDITIGCAVKDTYGKTKTKNITIYVRG